MANKTLNSIFSKEQVKDSVFNLYYNGLPRGLGIGIKVVDNLIRWETGRLSVITGVPNLGKSEFIDFMLVRLNRLHGWKTLYFSPENYPIGYHLQKLVSKISCKRFDKNEMTENELYNTIDYISENFFFCNYETVDTLDGILACALQLKQEKDIKVLVIDPYNRIAHNRPANLTETEYISKLLDTLSNFAKKNDVLIHLVAHPRKIQCKEGVFEVPNYYDINGSANFANKTDYCIAVHRKDLDQNTEIHVHKVKFKNLGCQGIAQLKYYVDSGNYYEKGRGDDVLPSLPQHATAQSNQEHIGEPSDPNRNVLNVPVSYYDSRKSTKGQVINLYNYLKNRNDRIDLDAMRKHPDFKELKTTLPAITVSGVFEGNRKTENLKQHSGLLCIDIDGKDQKRYMSVIFNDLKKINYIAYLGYSCSGKGLFFIVPIKDTQKHLDHFLALEKDMADMGIIIDKSCKDITRLRYYSYDPQAYFNEKAETYTTLYTPPTKEHRSSTQSNGEYCYNNTAIAIYDQKLNSAIKDIQANHINIAENYNDWRDLAMIFNIELGEDGRQLFHAVSSQSSKYDEGECDNAYDKIGRYGYQDKGIGSFYGIANKI